MDKFLMAFIALRMKEMGFEDYTFEPVRVTDAAIDATNEYYYLISESITSPTLIIRSDTNIFTEAADYNNFSLYGIQEFTGGITIDETDIVNFPIDYEFLRVIPRVKLSQEKQKLIENYLHNVH